MNPFPSAPWQLLTCCRLTYEPVALTFSFTSKELQNDPLPALRDRFESVDIKLLVDYAIHHTTHVVSKKRNTAKGLQALVNGRFIVSEPYLDAITQAAQSVPQENGADTCPLEQDFDKHWPNPMDYLPPRGAEPVDHPDSIYAPDKARQEVFEGYTFIFYDSNQYNNLMAPITNGGGKALLEHIVAGETPVDDFIRYVKTVAGEKGLGSFDDGNQGRGVVLVRYLPAKGDHVQWFADFFTNVSLRLDHRPIEQNEFLEAILVKDASMLRRPLEVEPAGDENAAPEAPPEPITQQTIAEEPVVKVSPSKRRARGPIKRRFAGFDEADISVDMEEIPQFVPAPTRGRDTEEGLFVSQEAPQLDEEADIDMGSPRKRTADAMEEDELMEDVAPAAARLKRQRVARGEALEALEPEIPPTPAAKPPPKKKKELDVLAAAKKHREEEEARARAEQEDLANLPADIDLAEIRRLNIVEEVELRTTGGATRTREQDIADGRWDPKWNGVKNFKKFRQRGQAAGRQPARTIVQLEEAKTKEFGVGDAYWLEDDSVQANRNKSVSQQSNTVSDQPLSRPTTHTLSADVVVPATVEDDADSLLAEDSQPVRTGSRSQRSRVTQTQSQGSKGTSQAASSRASQNPAKRTAPESSTTQSSSKRPRTMPKFMQNQDSDDSDDDLKFKFGRRR